MHGKNVPTTVAKFPRGVVRSAGVRAPANSSKVKSPASSRNDIIETKKASQLNAELENTDASKRDVNTHESVTSDNGNQRDRNLPPLSPGLSKLKSSFNQYTFYTKVTTNRLLLNEEENKRKLTNKYNPCSITDDEVAPKFESYYAATNTEERLKEWTMEAYRTRLLQSEYRDYPHNWRHIINTARSSVSPRASGDSSVSPHPLVNVSRRGSVFRQRRRSSVFWVPPVYKELSETERQEKRSIRTFRWYGQLIRSMVGLLMDMQRLSISKTQQSAYSEFLYIMAGARTHAGQEGQGEESQHLLFDKSWFSRNRAWSRMPPWAQNVMQLRPDLRTADDIQHLKQLLLTMRSFRENMTEEMRTKICQVVRYTRCDKGRVVLRQGHTGFDFYFIFSGSVFVQFDVHDERTGETYSTVENILKSGEGFGEIALLGDGVRTATVICRGPTELCQIDKATFLEICPALFNEQLQEKIKFARQFPIFQFWEPDVLKQLCFLSQVLEVPHSTVVEHDWTSSKFAFFVIKGRMSMLKEFDVTDITEMTGQTRGMALGSSDRDNLNQKKKHSQYAHVGTLYHGDCTDLSVLSVEPRKDMAHITLVSEGVRLFRVTVRTFQRLAPKKAVEEYLKKVYRPRIFPSEEQLSAHYLNNLKWSEFKKSIVIVHNLQKTGHMVASIPATLKGSSGWARWPGYTVNSKADKYYPMSMKAVEKANKPSDSRRRKEHAGTTKKGIKHGTDKLQKKKEETDDEETEEEDELDEDDFKEPPPPSPDALNSEMFSYRLVSDRSMTLIPPLTRSIASWRKSSNESLDAYSCVFRV